MQTGPKEKVMGMDKLVVISDQGMGEVFPLEKVQVELGRDSSNDVCLSDKSVSRVHACISQINGIYFLEDRKSTNGTLLNGVEIHKQALKSGDEITIGKFLLRFESDDLGTEADLDKTIVIRRQPEKRETPQPKSEHKLKAGTGSEAQVRFLSGPQEGDVKILDRAFYTIGKPGGDLLLINRRHTGYFLLKMGGDHAPTVNGETVKVGGVELKDGDKIRLGSLDLEFICNN
jgi:pSer/pThr/pTyr-binding forkhead associated (FHA) protein